MSIVKGLILGLLFLVLIYKNFCLKREKERQRDFFIKTLSHDFRVAMIAQLRGLESLTNYSYDKTSQRELIDEIDKSCRYSLDMLSMLMFIYRQEQGDKILDCSNFSLNRAVREIINNVKNISEDKNIEFYIDLKYKGLLFADRELFSKLVLNLLITAINYSQKGNVINLTTRSINGTLEIVISYKGRSLTNTEYNRMFFKDTTFSTVGHGIRMQMCKKIVDFHGGKIFVKKQFDDINTFIFSLPLCKKEQNAKSPCTMLLQTGI